MDKMTRKRVEAAGFQVSTVADFLGLTPEENELIETKVALSIALKKLRKHSNLSQKDFADHLQSSQSRVAKMEAGDASVSVDLLIRALFALGMTRHELALVIAPPPKQQGVSNGHNVPVRMQLASNALVSEV